MMFKYYLNIYLFKYLFLIRLIFGDISKYTNVFGSINIGEYFFFRQNVQFLYYKIVSEKKYVS